MLTLDRLRAIVDGSALDLRLLRQRSRHEPPESVPSISAPKLSVPESFLAGQNVLPLPTPVSPESRPRKQRRRLIDVPAQRTRIRSQVRQTVIPVLIQSAPAAPTLPDARDISSTDALFRRVLRIKNLPLDFIPNPMFEKAMRDAKVERELLALWESDGSVRHKAKVPTGLPPYLASLYEIPLLSREHERHLFRRMNYLKRVACARRDALDATSPSPPLMDAIEELFCRIEETRNEIVRANLRLVVSIAKRHANSQDDLFALISDGNMSLLRAVEKFDFGRGFKFSTYASWAIMKNFARTIPHEYKRRGREKTTSSAELIPLMGSGQLSMDYCDQPDRIRQRNGVLDRFLQVLDEREFEIIVLRFGLDGEEPKTLKQTGAQLGVTKERIRQLQTRAMGKLKKAATEAKIDFDSLFPEGE